MIIHLQTDDVGLKIKARHCGHTVVMGAEVHKSQILSPVDQQKTILILRFLLPVDPTLEKH